MKRQKTKRIPAGSVFQRVYTDRHGQKQLSATYTLRYYIDGRRIQVPTNAATYDEAVVKLREKMAESASTKAIASARPETVRMNQLFDLLNETNAQRPDMKTADGVKRLVNKHLRPWFGKLKAQAVTTQTIRDYKAARVKTLRMLKRPNAAGTKVKKNAYSTIDKELAYLKRSFRLGARENPPLVLHIPHIEMFNVDNVRTGIVSEENYQTLRELLPPYARVALVIGYLAAPRKGEITAILKEWVNFDQARIELPGKITKNGEPRYIPIYREMEAELKKAIAAGDPDCPFLIQNEGKRVGSWRKSWLTACTATGIPASLFHDLRRTATTNLIEAGIDQKEAMEITGHKTPSTFRRYHIVKPEQLQTTTTKLAAHMKAKVVKAKRLVQVNAAKSTGVGTDMGTDQSSHRKQA